MIASAGRVKEKFDLAIQLLPGDVAKSSLAGVDTPRVEAAVGELLAGWTGLGPRGAGGYAVARPEAMARIGKGNSC